MPFNFSWVIEGRLAASGQPGGGSYFGDSLLQDLTTFKDLGIGLIVSLTEHPLDSEALEQSGLRGTHLPIPDMTPPGQDLIDQFFSLTDEVEGQGQATLVHCRAGLGRTGTIVACYLARGGLAADEAIEQVRQMRPGSIETVGQEEAVRIFAARQPSQQQA